MISFSLFLAFFSIWNFFHLNQNNSFLVICCSIALLVVSIFLSSQNYGERALAMRNCYIRLNELYLKAKRAEEAGDAESLQKYFTNYNDILRNIENHSEYDYLRFRFSLRNNKESTLPPFSFVDYCFFFIKTSFFWIRIVFLFLLPFIIQLIWIHFS